MMRDMPEYGGVAGVAGKQILSAENEGYSRRVIWGALLVLVVFFVWANLARIDQITRAPGSIIASSRTQVIQSQDGGILESLMVQEGDLVEAGQLLARIDSTRAEAAYLETRAAVAAMSARVARLQAEILDEEIVFPSWLKDYPQIVESQQKLKFRRYEALVEELGALTEVKKLMAEELALNLPLLEAGDVSRTELLRLERQVAEMGAQITNKKNSWLQEAQSQLSEAEAELGAMEQKLVQRQNFLDQTRLLAPVKGVVKNVKITTIGGVIRPGEEVMNIVPVEDALLIEAKVNPQDIAFIKEGMDATVKVDAYDYTVYGDLSGKLVFISADTLSEDLMQNETPYFRIRVRTEGRRFSASPEQDLAIQTGMTAMVEIKTGNRTVWQYLSKPIVKTLKESLGER